MKIHVSVSVAVVDYFKEANHTQKLGTKWNYLDCAMGSEESSHTAHVKIF